MRKHPIVNLLDNQNTDYISDFQYQYLVPFNNSLSKWLDDIITTKRVLLDYGKHFRNVYFSVILREGSPLVFRTDHEDREQTFQDIIDVVKEVGIVELRPAFWTSQRTTYKLQFIDDELYIRDKKSTEQELQSILRKLRANYVIADYVPTSFTFSEDLTCEHALDFWFANDLGDEPTLLCAVINIKIPNPVSGLIENTPCLVDLPSGRFTFDNKDYVIPSWKALTAELSGVSAAIPQISFFSTSVALKPENGFQFLRFNANPPLPRTTYNHELSDYLKDRFARQFKKRTFADRKEAVKNRLWDLHVKKHGRKEIRPYMQKLWELAVEDDRKNTKGLTLKQKKWAWKHGFLSYRLYQYGITEDNYQKFLSDYDYYWLNRINNDYQKWVNDKTTYRFIMEPFRQFVPEYYFSCFKRDGKTVIVKMRDCPADIPNGIEGVLAILRLKGKLAFKASAGTHGDGFYCLSYSDNTYYINNDSADEKAITALFDEIQSFYIVTEYLVMHDELKKIYPKSVNTVRIMVINAHGHDPQIMQTYMRIGSEKSGFTDNVGYGGVCVMVDTETGELYNPEQLKDHVYVACPKHPDTGIPISGVLPNWDYVKENILTICRYLCELEYLGFDVAITNDGFQILEINIHQDLHKVASFSPEIMDFFHRKIRLKGGTL